MSLKSLRYFIILCYGTNVINDLEFILLYDYSESGEIYLYQKYNQFNLEIIDEAQCVTEFQYSTAFWCTSNGIEALCILLKRRSHPCRLSGMVSFFWKKPYRSLSDIWLRNRLYTTDLISSLVLGTKIFYRTNWHFIAT